MENKVRKRIIAAILAALMIIGLIPVDCLTTVNAGETAAFAEPKVLLKSGDKKLSLSWTGDASTTSYDLAYRLADSSERYATPVPESQREYSTVFTNQTTTSYVFTDLKELGYYYFRVTAHGANGETSVGYANGYYQSNNSGKTFTALNIGSGSGSGKISGDFTNGLTLTPGSSKLADSEDGFSYYYTSVKASENFIITATFTVKDGSNSDNQSGLGIIATDTLGTKNSKAKYLNSVACGAFKLAGKETLYRAPGFRYVTGYVDPKGNVPYDPASTAEYTPGLRNMVNKYSFDSTWKDTGFVTGSTYTFTLRKSNSGYEGTMSGDNQTFIQYDADSLMVQEDGKIYAGFFASRNIVVNVTDMNMTVLSAASDEPAVDPPVEYMSKSVNVSSPTTTGIADYNYEIRANYAGTISITDDEGRVVVSGDHINANEYYHKAITLTKEKTTLTATVVPDANPLLENLDPVTRKNTVMYKQYGTENQTIVVSADGKATGTGSYENPLDIYTAVAYAQPGQTILMKNGTYALTNAVTIQKGHNGDALKPISVIAESYKGVVLDYTNLNQTTGAGWTVSGDYWHVYGLEIKNTPHDVVGLQVRGHHNTIEMVVVHDIGTTGLQINGSSQDTIDLWPSDNYILNCEAYNCIDSKMNDADGFAAKITCGYNNVFEGCISHNNIDDGWDLYAKSTSGQIGPVVIKNCVAYANGYLTTYEEDGLVGEGNGFKLGGENIPSSHQLLNSVSFCNGARGVTSNSNPYAIIHNVINYNNSVLVDTSNFALFSGIIKATKYEVTGVISINNNTKQADQRTLVNQSSIDNTTNYYWNGTAAKNSAGKSASTSWFESVDTTVLPTRNADGTINMHNLLKPTSSMPADTGVDYAELEGTKGTITDIEAKFNELKAQAITDVDANAYKLIQDYVKRMYNIVLGRDAEEEGLYVWSLALRNNQVSGADVANMFICGPEFEKRGVTDSEFVDIMYKTMMDRESEPTGKATWLEVLDNGMSRTFVLSQFVQSDEFTAICNRYGIAKGSVTTSDSRDKNYKVTSFVSRCYKYILERKGEEDGLNTWTNVILTKQAEVKEIAHMFLFSDEENAKNLSSTEYTYILYRTFMGREPESEDVVNMWASHIETDSLETVFEFFDNSDEFKDIVAGYGL